MDSIPVTDEPPLRVVPLPFALYESNGILFELYNGGRPIRTMTIRWERLRPISVIGNETVPSEALPIEL
jgi:hypothetical protein